MEPLTPVSSDADTTEGSPDPLTSVLVLAAFMWVLEIVDVIPGVNLDRYGIRPRHLWGLAAILSAPFLHFGFVHLFSNTVPFIILGVVIAVSGSRILAGVLSITAVVSGLGIWLIAPSNSIHLGASGVVFGMITYLLARGVFSRRPLFLAVGAAVLFFYGGALWGVLPLRPGVSWQGHLFGALGGVLAAKVLHPPTSRSTDV